MMARKTAEQLRSELEAAEAAERLATDGLVEAQEAFENAASDIVDGTPEQLLELQSAFKTYVAAIKANWRYRGLPVMTEEQREKAKEATRKSKAKKAAEAELVTA